jgi:peptidoglycan/xylan/chitin deacetylase (PgdA/CDA1 family)
MIPVIKRLGFAGITALSMEWLKKVSPIRVISPFHHLVSDEPVPYIEKLYAFKNSRQFEADLDYFLSNFRPLSLEEVIQQEKTGRPFEKPGFLLCFDDGLRQVYETAAPILLRKGVPAAFFINSAFVDNQDIFYNFKKGLILDKFDRSPVDKKSSVDEKVIKEAGELLGQKFASARELRTSIRSINYLNRQLMEGLGRIFELDFEAFRKEQRPFMTTAEIKELIAKGFAIGSHSIDHPLYALITPEEQIRQTRESTDWTIKTFGLPYKAFAFPHIDTGVGHAFFEEFVGSASPGISGGSSEIGHTSPGTGHPVPEMDLLLGNSTGMLEQHPRVIHRFIGENPAIPIDTMVKSVLAYGALRKKIGRPFVQRN